MKIALLAPSGAGKTAYLTGLYGVLTQDLSHSDYGIDTTVTDSVLDSFLSDRFDELTDGVFAEGTKETTRYPLKLRTTSSDQKHDLKLEIVDFKGGDLHQTDEETAAEKEKTIKGLSECDGFIVLLDGQSFIDSVSKQNPRKLQNLMRAHAINEVLTAALERRKSKPASHLKSADKYAFGHGKTPIVFALTKGDQVSEWLNEEDVSQKIEQTLHRLFQQRAESGIEYDASEGPVANFIRSQFPKIMADPEVATLRMAVSAYDQGQDYFEPLNLEYAFQFVLFNGLINAKEEYFQRMAAWRAEESDDAARARRHAAERDRQERRLNDYNSRGFWEWLGGKLDGESSSAIRQDYNRANSSYDSALSDKGRSASQKDAAHANQAKIELFRTRILSDSFVHRLSLPRESGRFYVEGMPLDDLKQEHWWKRKAENGKKVLDQRDGPVI